jgi:hypothetical protein
MLIFTLYQENEPLNLNEEVEKIKKWLLYEYCVLTLHVVITEFREIPFGV